MFKWHLLYHAHRRHRTQLRCISPSSLLPSQVGYTVIRCSLGLSPYVRYSNPLITLRTVPWTLSNTSMLSLYWRTQSSTQHHRWVSPVLNRGGGITSFDLLAMLCSKQTSMLSLLQSHIAVSYLTCLSLYAFQIIQQYLYSLRFLA